MAPRAAGFVSVVAPLHDDADIVQSFVEDVLRMLAAHYDDYELVLVDDGSRDETAQCVTVLLGRHRSVRLIRLSRSFGQEIAISAGLEAVIGDFVVVMLPDSDPPALVPEMVERARRGAGIVFGIRRNRASEPLILRIGASGFYWLSNNVFKLNLPKDSTHFRVMSRQAVTALNQIRDRTRYLRTLSGYVGYASQSVPYEQIRRRSPPRTKSLVEAVSLALGILASNSLQPLRLVSWMGILLSAANALYIAYIGAIVLFKPTVAEGWTTVSTQVSVMFLFLFLMLSVLSAYLARLLEEGRDRPLYFIMEERNSSVPLYDAERRNVVTEAVER